MKYKPNKSSKNKLPLIGVAIISFAFFAVSGLSLITGDQQPSNVGTTLASAQEPADINSDNVVDIVDLSILLSNWNTTDNLSDINNDNVVDIVDLSILLSKWGTVIVEPPVIGYVFPTIDSVGPRVDGLNPSGGISSEYDGQIISGLEVTGRLTVRHDNVIVRDTKINGMGTYMITTSRKDDGQCPVNILFEYIEIDGAQAAENDIPIYTSCGNITVDHAYVHNVGRSSRVTNNMTISNSYIYSDRTGDSGAHRGAVGNNGGSNNALINNVLKCRGTGCSAAMPMYGDFAPVNGYYIEHNLLATTGSYCTYGGSLASKPYPEGSNIRFIDNHFSTEFFDTCGRYGVISGFANNVRGNEWTGNVWHETGEAIER